MKGIMFADLIIDSTKMCLHSHLALLLFTTGADIERFGFDRYHHRGSENII